MRKAILIALSVIPSLAIASPSTYEVICSVPCQLSDGQTHPAGTVVNRISAEPNFDPGQGLALQVNANRPIWSKAQDAPTTIETGDFVARFTTQEIAAVMAWNPAMVFQVSSAKTIDVTSPRLRAGLAAAVAAGALTKARVDQLLTP